MSGATMWRTGNVREFLETLSGAMEIRNEIGNAEDSRLAQPDRITWVPLQDSRRMRECTNREPYPGLTVYYEASNEYNVVMRSIDVDGCEALERHMLYKLIEIGAWMAAVEFGGGSIQPKSVAAEEGAAIIWKVRLWTPIVHEALVQGHITTTSTSVIAVDAAGNIGGTVP